MSINSWQGYGGESYGGRGETGYRPGTTDFAGMRNNNSLWGEQYRGNDPLSFGGYDNYMNSFHSGAPVSNLGNSRITLASTSTGTASQANRFDNARRNRNSVHTPGTTNESSVSNEFGRTTRASREDSRLAQVSRSFDYVSALTANEPPSSRRRMPPRYDASDDDEDSPESGDFTTLS